MIQTAWAKLLLFGEYTALIGGRALGISLPLRAEIEQIPAAKLNRAASGQKIYYYAGHYLEAELQDEKLHACFRAFCDLLPDGVEASRFSLRSNIPSGSGLGSSAAIVGAFAGFLAEGDSAERRRYAGILEQLFHGRSSGIDTVLALLPEAGMLCALYFHDDAHLPQTRILPLPPSFFLVVAIIARSKSTRELVEQIQQKDRNILVDLGCIAEAAEDVLLTGNSDSLATELGQHANKAQELLHRLGVSSPELAAVLRAGLRAGASGAKLSGAGGGGSCYFICRDESVCRAVAESCVAGVQQCYVIRNMEGGCCFDMLNNVL